MLLFLSMDVNYTFIVVSLKIMSAHRYTLKKKSRKEISRNKIACEVYKAWCHTLQDNFLLAI